MYSMYPHWEEEHRGPVVPTPFPGSEGCELCTEVCITKRSWSNYDPLSSLPESPLQGGLWSRLSPLPFHGFWTLNSRHQACVASTLSLSNPTSHKWLDKCRQCEISPGIGTEAPVFSSASRRHLRKFHSLWTTASMVWHWREGHNCSFKILTFLSPRL